MPITENVTFQSYAIEMSVLYYLIKLGHLWSFSVDNLFNFNYIFVLGILEQNWHVIGNIYSNSV